jgi:hypothetical protein
MPDLYSQIANGTYGRTYDRWAREPDFEELIELSEDVSDGEGDEIIPIDEALEGLI